jgi:carbon-monoxide dehydrogenase iron sulfur subunit
MGKMPTTARIRIFRYDPEDGKPYYQDYQIPMRESLTVIRALLYLSENHEDPPAFRRFMCNRGQCAGCVMTIDGRTLRACTTKVKDAMVIEPLYDYPVIKDLVVDFGTKVADGNGGYYTIRKGSHILKSNFRRRSSLSGPWLYMKINSESCSACTQKPCVRACPVNQIENLEDRNGRRLAPLSGPIRLEDGRAVLAGVCQECGRRPCIAKCPTQAFQGVAKGVGTRIKIKKCIGCGLCLAACSYGNIWLNLERGHAVKCDLCSGDPKCLQACPHGAIAFDIIHPEKSAEAS